MAQLQLPQIDLSGLREKHTGTPEWEAARAQVLQALRSYGCFEVIYDGVNQQLREAVFRNAAREVHSLPAETKSQSPGYLGHATFKAVDSSILDATPEGIQSFTNLMWPQGNASFCETIKCYVEGLKELGRMIQKMVLEGLGVEEYHDSLVESTHYTLRLSSYSNEPGQQQKMEAFPSHKDPNLLTIIFQDEISGLEVQIKNGDWIRASPNSFIVMPADSFEAWTNGRLQSVKHRVVLNGDEMRHSTILAAAPKEGYVVQAPKKLVDQHHPALFKPFDFAEYFRFRTSEAALKAEDVLKAYCGVQGDQVEEEA
ncbi:probable 2-oxoglutarate-dependent dioxygenase AOP1 [Phoenix dactylifera]|uniref:Probable 2-oxoglutarate-dependent dioxygenase AOP1 n=1 Tax=Phoenix dactylifera TaxID=42345 RepID=A0A8B7CY62_PHODC|nr:probable 2-oxoglutarate-dependent dioxygenase AOP1 [Phoenix dactylifera]